VLIRRACITVALAIVAAAIVESAASSIASRSESTSIGSCTTSELKIRLVSSGVAAGTVGGYIGFTNRGSVPCRLTGWPTLVALMRAGKSTPALHVRSTMFGPRPIIKGLPVVRLRHGERADAVFTGGDNPGPNETTCPPAYRYLRVTSPGSSRSVLLSAWLSSYGHYLPACTRIEVSMVVPASDLYHG